MNVIDISEIRRLREQHTRKPVDIEEIREHVQKLRGIVLAGAQETSGGHCDDCTKDHHTEPHERLWTYGRLTLCQTHLEPRLRARARHDAQHG